MWPGSCQVCHRESEDELTKNVTDRQDHVRERQILAENALVRAHLEAQSWAKGAEEAEMKPILTLIRHAQWRWDWVAAANGVGFHSPAEALRTLGTSIQKAQEAHAEIVRVLARRGILEPFTLPDVSTKEKAQRYIGLDMVKAQHGKGSIPEGCRATVGCAGPRAGNRIRGCEVGGPSAGSGEGPSALLPGLLGDAWIR